MAKKNQRFTPLSNMETSSFCSQMAMILRSGISSVEGLSLMLEEAQDAEEKELLELIYEMLQSTGSFHQALAATEAFPAYMLQMVRLGELSGKTDDVMAALADHYQREASIAQSIKNAVTYPMIMIVMMVLVFLVLVTKVMPIFNQVFIQLGSEMTGFSKAILNFGTSINRSSIILIGILVVLVAVVLYFSRTKSGRARFGKFAAWFAGTRAFAEKIAACRFASGMHLTLSSGMSPEEALSLTENLIDNESFKKKLETCKEKIGQGGDFSKVLLDTGIFSGLYARMTSIGSRTGVLDEIMEEIAEKYQEDIDQKFSRAIAALEPTLVIVLSLIVGVILLSVMLPLAGIMSNL
ncbi:type II secretion system F family protein [Clostridiales bacterium]|nr:type II secretion system F family protein [Clostridiales bacterium]